ncbi:MAG: hypothetical protein ATN31_01915 [Candidatus Epulonipiscioides saccharophilum]|nr:MAG: hypothetical protein ATN31_01915 [Epulopiscium sp. AS2M-Bin001]
MKIAVIGAGAMGCIYGAYLSLANEVILLDVDESQVKAINQDGITLEDIDENTKNYRNVQAFLTGTYNHSVDLVIIFVKTTVMEQALHENSDLFQDNTIVVTLQNGAGNDRKIERYVKDENILIGTSSFNSVNLGNGRVRRSGVGLTTLGSNFDATDKVDLVAKLFTQCGLAVKISDDIQRIIWTKLFINLSVNCFTALIETPIGYMPTNKYAWDFAKRLIYEAVDVAEADGTYFDRRETLEMVRKVCQDAGNGYSSMYQDRQNHVKMEIDSINGAIVEQAKQYGVPTPYNSLIVDLIHAVEGAYDYYK